MITTSTAALRHRHWTAASWLPRKAGAVMLITVLAIVDTLAVFVLLAMLSALTLLAVPGLANAMPLRQSVSTLAAPRLPVPPLVPARNLTPAVAAGRQP